MCALLSGLYIRGDHEGGGLAKEGKKCVFKGKNLLTEGSKFFPFKVDSFSEGSQKQF